MRVASSLERKRPSNRRIEADANQLSHSLSPVQATSRPREQATQRLLVSNSQGDKSTKRASDTPLSSNSQGDKLTNTASDTSLSSL
jgi:hypothetical protein